MTRAHLPSGGGVGDLFASVRGLHEGTVRELGANNPHAVFTLMRAWSEVIALAIYVRKKPAYAASLLNSPKNGGPGTKSFEAIFHAIQDEAANMKAVYSELSDYTHFRARGVWSAHTLEEDGVTTWTDAPNWSDDRQFKIACALAHESAVAGQYFLDQLGQVLAPATP